MKRVLLSVLLLSLSQTVGAIELAGVKVAEKVQAGGQSLVLNGAGTRLMVGMFHVYAIALYLPEPKHSVAEVLDEQSRKRVTLDFMFGVTSVQLLEATYKLMTENLSADEMKRAEGGWKQFAAIFDKVPDINKGDHLVLDHQPGTGVNVSLNGKEIGRVADARFIRGFLMAWLGDRPAQADLKDRLLGITAANGK